MARNGTGTQGPQGRGYTHLWAETYDGDMTQVFRFQSRVAQRVAQSPEIELLDAERHAIDALPTQNLDAYDLYLRAGKTDDLVEKQHLLERANL